MGPGVVIDDTLEKRRKVLLICTIFAKPTREAERERKSKRKLGWNSASQMTGRLRKSCVFVFKFVSGPLVGLPGCGRRA